jgi:hypothetical protein
MEQCAPEQDESNNQVSNSRKVDTYAAEENQNLKTDHN